MILFFASLAMTLTFPGENSYQRVFYPGVHFLEVWGADGVDRNAPGGYSSGYLLLMDKTTFYINVGGKGKPEKTGKVLGGYNGGGNGYSAPSGGGGTDIRVKFDRLDTRIIVAGGGAGAITPFAGGISKDSFGGGLKGGETEGSSRGAGGEQTRAGTECAGTGNDCKSGSFGYGGNATSVGAGGGGGWFGGSSGGNPTGVFAWGAGGGGSGFVLNETTYTNTRLSSFLRTDPQFRMYSTTMISGNGILPTKPAGGNGYARITEIKRAITPTNRRTPAKTATPFICPTKIKCSIKKIDFKTSLQTISYSVLLTALEDS